MSVKSIKDEVHFQNELAAAGIKLVVVDFTAAWCGPCQRIAPLFDKLPQRYPNGVFLKVDVDRCQETAVGQNVTAMPTFILYKNRINIDRLQGANFEALEDKIKQYIDSVDPDDENVEFLGQGLMDLNNFIAKNDSECLNESDDHTMLHSFSSGGGYLQSDCDEQLIMSITFNQVVKLHSIKCKAPENIGPKNIKLFMNQPRTIDFDMAESITSVQDLCLTPKDLEGQPVHLRYVKFQNVQNIQIFVKDNQTGADKTQIDYIGFIGTPVLTTKMEEFKRISGKKGESH